MTPFRRELEYFLLICESLNLSVAAERAGIQQAGLSRSLKQLEADMGQPLFYRTNRGLKITPFGEAVKKNLLQTISSWESAFEKSLESLQTCSGTISIGAHPTIAINSVSKVYSDLIEKNEDLHLKLELKKSVDVTRDVLNFGLDLGVVANPTAHQDLIIKPVANEQTCVWARKGSSKLKVIYYNPEMVRVVQNIKKFRSYKRVEIGDYEVIAAVLQNSGGVGILPSPVGSRTRGLIQLGRPLDHVSICLIYRFDVLRTRAFQEVQTRLLHMASH